MKITGCVTTFLLLHVTTNYSTLIQKHTNMQRCSQDDVTPSRREINEVTDGRKPGVTAAAWELFSLFCFQS